MEAGKAALILAAVGGNLFLGGAYAYQKPSPSDFGSVPASLHSYLLVAAVGAYVCHLAFLAILASQAREESVYWIAAACVSVFVAAEAAFFPLLRSSIKSGEKWRTRALLLAAAAPMVVLAWIGVDSKGPGAGWMAGLGTAAAVHFFVNDALLFGAMF